MGKYETQFQTNLDSTVFELPFCKCKVMVEIADGINDIYKVIKIIHKEENCEKEHLNENLHGIVIDMLCLSKTSIIEYMKVKKNG